MEGLDTTPLNFFCELFIYDIIMKKKLGALHPALPLDIWLDIFFNQIYRFYNPRYRAASVATNGKIGVLDFFLAFCHFKAKFSSKIGIFRQKLSLFINRAGDVSNE